jgi:aryl-alcohol dehydrogenase-like predicted oxidoreductase
VITPQLQSVSPGETYAITKPRQVWLACVRVGPGCYNFGGRIGLDASRRVVDRAIDLGITFFDTADIYGNAGGSETILGEILGDRRKDFVLATKFGMVMSEEQNRKGASRRYIMRAVEDSLKRLQTDWIDLYQLHTPDALTPIEETLRALDDLIRQGKVRYIGCSNLPAWQVVEAQWTSRNLGLNSFVSCQDEYSLLVRDVERDLVPAMQAYELGLIPYFPLASGLLSGKYERNAPLPEGARLTNTARLADRYLTEANWDRVERMREFSETRGRSLLDLAFAWLLARPQVATVIAGATKPEQVEQNVAAAQWTLNADDVKDVEHLLV